MYPILEKKKEKQHIIAAMVLPTLELLLFMASSTNDTPTIKN